MSTATEHKLTIEDPVIIDIVRILQKARPNYRLSLLDILTRIKPLIQSRRIRPHFMERFNRLVQNDPLGPAALAGTLADCMNQRREVTQ